MSKKKQETKQIKVFVVDVSGKQCLPTTPRRARKLLETGRAKVLQVMPFTVKLSKLIENPIGNFTVGIDDGAKYVGVSIINEHTQEVVFAGEIRLRQDVSRKITQRALYRRTRRSRKTRNRQPRFSNRKQMVPAPSVRQRKDSIIRWLKDMMKRVNITKVVVEEGVFDTSSMVAGHRLHGNEFKKSEYEGKNWKAKVLWRDEYTCQHCSVKGNLCVHHIIQKKDGGSNRVANGITLCKKCHEDLHRGLWKINTIPKNFKYPAWLMIGKTYFKEQLALIGVEVEVVYGWMTSSWRRNIGLEKTHANDAISIVCKCYLPTIASLDWKIKPRRTKIWENHPTRTCFEKNGFRHFDIVKVSHKTRGVVVGSIKSLKAKALSLRTSFSEDFIVSYSNAVLIQRSGGLVYFGTCADSGNP